jgi:hypothetical protein
VRHREKPLAGKSNNHSRVISVVDVIVLNTVMGCQSRDQLAPQRPSDPLGSVPVEFGATWL